MPSNAQFFGNRTGQMINDVLGEIRQRREGRKQAETLKQFFPAEVSDLILSLPEKNRWDAIQRLAPEYGLSAGGNQDQEMAMANDLTNQQINTGPMDKNLLGQLASPLMTQRALQPEIGQSRPPEIKQPGRPKPPIKAGINKLGRALGKSAINANQSKDIQRKIESANELLGIADEMEKLWSTGKVLNGTKGSWARKLNGIAGISYGDETGTFDSLGSQAAILEASLIPGVTTNEKLKAAERTKPNITQSRNTQQARIKAMRKKAQEIIKQYSGSSSELKEESLEGLPDASQYPNEKFQKDGVTVQSVNTNGQWTWEKI